MLVSTSSRASACHSNADHSCRISGVDVRPRAAGRATVLLVIWMQMQSIMFCGGVSVELSSAAPLKMQATDGRAGNDGVPPGQRRSCRLSDIFVSLGGPSHLHKAAPWETSLRHVRATWFVVLIMKPQGRSFFVSSSFRRLQMLPGLRLHHPNVCITPVSASPPEQVLVEAPSAVQLTRLPAGNVLAIGRTHGAAPPPPRAHRAAGKATRASETLKSGSGRKPSFALACPPVPLQGDVEPEVSLESFSCQGPPARSVLPGALCVEV
uniref:Uncharacterized protein n=1 Tax=Rangifer tarandus platyrhynchus TaxID=3082113 RepID=A0ACB0E6P5_RANTA|nr:unnamed protein product [Rangifer tarandus platyrhynchus]